MMLGNFFPITIIFFCVYDFTDIDECKGNHSCHVNAMQFYNPPEKNIPTKATKADLWRLISDYSLEWCLERDSAAVEVLV